jgi:hypothetical protein
MSTDSCRRGDVSLHRVLSKARYIKEQRRLLRDDERRLAAAHRAGRAPGRIACTPDAPYPHSMLRRIASHLGLEIHTRPTVHDRLVLFWKDGDSTVREPSSELLDLAQTRRVLNIGSRDISKTTIAKAFEEAFGYPLLVDPLSYNGVVVEKPERNASHAGRLVTSPTKPRRGYCYQLLIGNELDQGVVQDIRVPVIGSTIPVLYLKLRPKEDRFSNVNMWVELADVSDVLRHDESRRLLRVAALLGIDYCEIDCVRDRESGRLYAVDVNTTPWGPPNHLPARQSEQVIQHLAATFSNEFLDSSNVSSTGSVRE